MEETSRDKGDALEKNIEFIFQSAGLETQRNARVAKYEIDILAKIGDRNVIVECKNYQNSSLTIRNLIHQWNSKNLLIKANKVILVLAGVEIKESDKNLASQFNIELWNQETLNELFNLSLKPSELRHKLLEEIDFKPITISEQYRDEISEFIVYPKVSNVEFSQEEIYSNFNDWLRVFIRTELQLSYTTKEDRVKHIELFEGTKEKDGLFKLFKVKRKEKEYWDTVRARLQKEILLDKETQEKYTSYMDELVEEYNLQEEFFEEHKGEDLIKRLISDRLYLALLRNQEPIFGFAKNETVHVKILDNGKFNLKIENINDKQANLVNWILTSEYFLDQKLDSEESPSYGWSCFSFEESVDKIYRILDEFYGYQEEKLIDFSL